LTETSTAASRPLPGIGRRLASIFYESLLAIGVLAITFLLPQVILGLTAHVVLRGPVQWLYIFCVLGLYFLYHWRNGRQTLAMRTWKLQIATSVGGTPSLQALAMRYLLAWPSLALGGIGILWALFDRDRQFLHDRLAGTKIVFRDS
jgi:uncharacterized RDD family membrane protein YckC